MPNYDFLNLSAFEFEVLSRDLLQKHLKVYLEGFTQGKDEGIDLRYSSDRNASFIVQCKRYKEYSALRSHIKEEYKKAIKLTPQRYILTTSVGLTPHDKNELLDIFDGYIKSSEDIFWNSDLNNLLGIHSEIEKKHFKLWLSNALLYI